MDCTLYSLCPVPCAIPLLLHHVSLFHLILVGRDYISFSGVHSHFYWRDESTSSHDCFDDNVTEGIENLTAVLNLSEYTLSLGVRLNQNSSTAIIYIEDNGESAGSHYWYAALF